MALFLATLKLDLRYRTRFLAQADAHRQSFDSIARFNDIHLPGLPLARPVRAIIRADKTPLFAVPCFGAGPERRRPEMVGAREA